METSENERDKNMINTGDRTQNNNSLDKEDLDDSTSLARQATASPNFNGTVDPIKGRTISGTGSGPGTGDAGGDFDRPGSGGKGINDWVSHEGINENQNNNETENSTERSTELEKQAEDENADRSYMPGSGAVRTAEDRISPGNVDKDSIPPGAGTF